MGGNLNPSPGSGSSCYLGVLHPRQLVAYVEEIMRLYAEEGLPCTILLCGDQDLLLGGCP